MQPEDWSALVDDAVAQRPGPAPGFEIGACFRLDHAGAFGYLVVNTRDLGELLETYHLLETRFYGRGWSIWRLTRLGGSLAWPRPADAPHPRVLEQLHATALLTAIRACCPDFTTPARAAVTNPALDEEPHYRAGFGCPVTFDSPMLRLSFSATDLAAEVRPVSGALGPAWRGRQRTLRETMSDAPRFVAAVQESMLALLPSGAPADLVASRLGLSRRTLQRRLTEAGCTYRGLLDAIRQRHATTLLDDPVLGLGEIAFLLGYSEQSAFNHVYRRWHGSPPRRRRAIGAKNQDD